MHSAWILTLVLGAMFMATAEGLKCRQCLGDLCDDVDEATECIGGKDDPKVTATVMRIFGNASILPTKPLNGKRAAAPATGKAVDGWACLKFDVDINGNEEEESLNGVSRYCLQVGAGYTLLDTADMCFEISVKDNSEDGIDGKFTACVCNDDDCNGSMQLTVTGALTLVILAVASRVLV